MELPKNTTQIGEMHGTYKIFIEDYVISYLKQITRQEPDRKKKILLYGVNKTEEDQKYFFIYEGSDELCESAEMLFQGHSILGYVLVEDELPEGIHLTIDGKNQYIQGYRIFYEKNEGMLAYLIHRQKQLKEVKPKTENELLPQGQPGQYVTMKYRQQAREEIHKGEIPTVKLVGIVKCAAAAFLIVLCVTAISAINGVDKLVGFQNFFQKGVEAMEEQGSMSVTSDKVLEENISTVSNNETTPIETVSQETVPQETVSQETVSQETVSQETVSQETVPQETVPQEIVPQETATQEITTQETTVNTHTVLKGQTLNVISEIYYGNDSRVQDICSANGITNPNNIKIGQKIILP